ncbi:MAG: ankyrin repeat domain-containing protein [Pyrinomonadaceae bacterium]
MSKRNFHKNLFEITSPCSQDWDAMKGNDKVRFCEHCALEVNNLSAARRKDALRLMRQSKGGICVRYVKNPSNNQPVFADRLYQIARRAPRLAVGAMTAALSLSTVAYAQNEPQSPNVAGDIGQVRREKKSDENKTENPTASISGTVKDITGAVVPGVVVTLVGERDSFNKTATSNDEGFYEFVNLAPGTYTIKVEAARGFTNTQIEGLAISGGANLQSDVEMQVSGVNETVGGIGMIEYELPLLKAVSEDNLAEIKSLLAGGADVNGREKNSGKITALFIAVENGNIETVKTLLEFGAKINARDEEKQTALMRLDDDAAPELVKLLLSYGAKIKAVDDEDSNVLHHVAVLVKPEVLQILIDEGADIDAQNREGQTPLMIAADYENLESVKALLDAGANVNLRDKTGKTALGIALENEYKEIAELLISHGAQE